MPTPLVPKDTDDQVIPFRVDKADASGRLVRLGDSIDQVLTRHAYPDQVSHILGEALLLVAMFGSTIKERNGNEQVDITPPPNGSSKSSSERFILQTQTDGPISFIVADYHHPGHLRGYARFDQQALEKLDPEKSDAGQLLGKGHLAMTIDRGTDMDRYQGIVAMEGNSLSHAANLYFEQSEQLPTSIQLAMARHFDGQTPQADGGDGWRWRGGGLMVQKLTAVGGYESKPEDTETDAGEDEAWNRASILAESLRDHELLDPLLTPEELLFRLYHEDGVRVFDASPIEAGCGCSQDRVEIMLSNFTSGEQRDMVEDDGQIHITCEFCNRTYSYQPSTG